MKSPPRWTQRQLAIEAKKSAALFRQARLSPTDQWKTHVDLAAQQFKTLFDLLGDLAPAGMTDAAVAKAFREDLSEAMRYLAGPFISADDLKVVAHVASLAPCVIGNSPARARKAFAVIKQIIDPYRFPWVKGNREPTAAERSAALLASSVLLAASRVGTERATLEKPNRRMRLRTTSSASA